MKVFITGHQGYVGQELLKRGFLPLVCDITNWESVELAVQKNKPDLLIHLAAKSDVDFCEKRIHQDIVTKANLRGAYHVFENLRSLKLPGVMLSSDQVWHGGFFEKHTENSKRTPPVNFYGMSKVAAESVVEASGGKVIRTSYLFDSKRMADKLRDMEIGVKQNYPIFIRRSFLHLHDFCDMLEIYCDRFYKMPKILHLSGTATTSWYSFMREVENQYGFKHRAVKPRYFEKKGFAPRPWFGGLNTDLSFGLGFPKRGYVGGIERMKNEG